MKSIRIYGQLELEEHIKNGGPVHSNLISIGNPKRGILRFGDSRPDSRIPDIFQQTYKSIFRLSFFDVEEKRHLMPGQFPKRIPQRRDVRKAIRYYERTRSIANGYDIHCWQGISRSTGIALGYLFLETGSEEEAGRILQDIRPEAGPHRKIVGWFDELLGSRLTEVADRLRAERFSRWRDELGMTADDDLEELPEV